MIIQVTPEQKAFLKSVMTVVEAQTVHVRDTRNRSMVYYENCHFIGEISNSSLMLCAFDACTFDCTFNRCKLTHTALLNSVHVISLKLQFCMMIKSNFPAESREECVPFTIDLATCEDFISRPSGQHFPLFGDFPKSNPEEV